MQEAEESPPAPHPPSRPGPRRARWLGGAGLIAVTPLALLGVLQPLHDGPEPATVPSEGAPPAVREDAPGAGDDVPRSGDADGDGLDDALEAEVARRHAPRYRFTDHDPAGPDSAQNRREDHFPMSVARFLACLEAGVFERTEGSGRGVVRLEAGGRVERFDGARVVGFPSRLAGDPLGTAPVYVHVYPAPTPGELFCEYWVFYGYDRAEAAVLGIPVSLGDHRCDWEHTAYRVRLDPPRLLEGFYYGHARCLVVPEQDLERVEGEHPVVYVSQGKHASYPVACSLPSVPLPTWLVQHQDVANGLGPTWDAWAGPLVGLGERDRPSAAAARWLGFMGRWGPDGVELAGIELGTSPTGPAAKVSWGDHGRGDPWRERLEARGAVLLRAR